LLVARVPLIDLKLLNELAAVMQELQIGGTSARIQHIIRK
jgi:hypothetical protein